MEKNIYTIQKQALIVFLFLILCFSLFGCLKKEIGPIPDNPQYKGFYQLGYRDGCSSGNELAGNWRIEWEKSDIYDSEIDYKKGWDEGFLKCLGELKHTEVSNKALQLLNFQGEIQKAEIVGYFSLKAIKAISVNPLDYSQFWWSYHHIRSLSYLKKRTLNFCKDTTIDNECLIFAENNKIVWGKNLAEWEKKYIENKHNYTLDMDGYGNTILHLAAIYDRTDYLNRLLNNGADINIINGSMNFSPLISAVFYGKYNASKLLIEKGADVNISDTMFQNSPIIWAVKKEHTDIVKLLIENGAKIDFQNKYGETASDLAKKNGNENVLNLLKL